MILCRENGKPYIGQSIHDTPNRRYTRHWNEDIKLDIPLGRAFKKYGKNAFELRCLCVCSKEALNNLEAYYAEIYGSYIWDIPGGYNAVPCGKGRAPNFHHKEDHRKKMSERMTGVPKTNATKAKLSDARKGVPTTVAHKYSLKKHFATQFDEVVFPTRLNEWIIQYIRKGGSPECNSEDPDERRAGRWRQDMIAKRYAPSRKTGRPLTNEQIKILDETPGWTWKKPDEFIEQFENFKIQYVKYCGKLSRGTNNPEHMERHRAALWVIAMRVKKRNNHPYLTPERIKMLDECEFWSWTPK
jgi:group I intron endonuclease